MTVTLPGFHRGSRPPALRLSPDWRAPGVLPANRWRYWQLAEFLLLVCVGYGAAIAFSAEDSPPVTQT